MAGPGPALSPTPEEEVKLYTIHISSKYLNLTRQKLELTRLPHDVPQPDKTSWWEPKSTIEPLVDYWLEQYSWRDQEAQLNASVPQFRTAIRTDGAEAPVRVHFIHSRSTQADAVPLLLIPPFPFTNLSMTHLIRPFTAPDDAANGTSFHLVIPSLPGLGFSDAISSNQRMVPLICEMLDALMKRLGYRIYLATNTISSPNSVADIDFRIINHIAYAYPDSCVGAHLLSPPCQAPTWQAAPLEWVKWKMMTSLRTPGLGYTRDDIAALRKHRPPRQGKQRGLSLVPGLDSKAFESNMLAYALCDSPTGLLLFVIMVLRLLGPKHDFSSGDIIQLAELTWLPGPEGTMRLWAHCSSERDELPRPSRKPKVGITAFSGSTDGETGTQQQTCSAASSPDVHTCLAWAKTTYNVVSWQKAPGSSGLLAWERPEVLVAGVRALAKVVFPKDDSRRQAAKEAAKKPRITSLERVVLGENESARAEGSGTTIRGDAPPTLASDDDVERAQTKQGTSTDAKGAKRPPTPLFPLAWGQRSEAVRESRHASRSSSGGSPTTIKPLTSG